MHNNILDRWWFRAFAALMCFFLVQVYVTFSKVQTFEEDKMTIKAEVESLERKRDSLRMEIMSKERDVARMEKKSNQLEILVRDRMSLVGPGRKSAPMIYFITPTTFRPAQRADLTRLSYTLSHVPNLHWIVIEDKDTISPSIDEILRRSKLPYTHLNVATPSKHKMKYKDPSWFLPRGVAQRNAALGWLRTQLQSAKSGVVYFGDDDNVYDLRLFEDVRSVQSVGVWPVGIVGGLIAETPLLASNGTVVGFNSIWKPERPYPIDMAAFAVSITMLVDNPNAQFKYDVPRGYQESQFLSSLGIARTDLEPKGEGCTKVFVWHTRTEKSVFSQNELRRVTNISSSEFSDLEISALGLY